MTKKKFYAVEMEFLIEAEDKESARKIVTQHNFAKVLERENGWHNFEVSRVKRVKEEDLI